MDNLEKFIRKNAEMFNEAEPTPGHLDRFDQKLTREFGPNRFRFDRSIMIKIAAVILIMITVSVFVFDITGYRFRSQVENKSTVNALPAELRDALQYYDKRTDARLIEFRKLACCGNEEIRLNTLVTDQLNALDENAMELTAALNENPGDERIQTALIRNHQMKEKMMDNMIERLNLTKTKN